MTGGIIPFRWAASSRFGGRLRSESAQNAPGVAEPGMKADAALGRFGLAPSSPASARDDPHNNKQHDGAYSRIDDMSDGNAVKIKGPTQRPGLKS